MIDLEFRTEGGATLWKTSGQDASAIAFGLAVGDVVLVPGGSTRYLVLDKWVKMSEDRTWVVTTLTKEPDG